MQKILTTNNVWSFELFDYVAIYENDQLLTYTYTKPLSTKQIIDSSYNIYTRIKDNENYALVIPPSGDDKTVYTTLRIQVDFGGNDSLFIIGATSEKYFSEKFKSLTSYDGSVAYLVSKKGTIFSSNDVEQLGKKVPADVKQAMGKSGRSTVHLHHMDYVMMERKVNKEFRFVYLLPKSEIVKQTLSGMRTFIGVSLLIAVALIFVATVLILHMTEFIKDFIRAMGRVRDRDYDTKMEKYGNQTLDELVDTFNLMTGEISYLIRTTYESQILLNEMEIKSLQHQMNPHFLFNILLTIQIRAKMSGDETLYRMISSLSSLLRAGIYKDKRALISVGEELKYVEYYLWLQKERFEDRLTYSINVSDDSILECEIPRLVIEPMVENAVVHGVENTSDHATICVTLEYEEDTVLIHVIDNGVGFDTSAFETEGERVGTDGTIKREKMGLSNVDQRIKLMYGESYGLTIHSKQNEGTDIAIRIPRKKLEITDDSSNDSR